MGGGNNAGMRVAAGRYFFLLNSDAWVRRRRARAARRVRRRASGGGGRRPAAANTDGTLQRSVRGEPTLWRLATEYLFIRKLAPRSRLLNPLYAGGFDHDERARGGLALRPGAARAARGRRRGRAVRRGLLHVQRGGRLADAVPPRRLEGAVLPGRRGRARRRRVARRPLYVENLRGHLRFLAKHRGREEAERARRLLLVVAAAAGARRCAVTTTARACGSSRPATRDAAFRDP